MAVFQLNVFQSDTEGIFLAVFDLHMIFDNQLFSVAGNGDIQWSAQWHNIVFEAVLHQQLQCKRRDQRLVGMVVKYKRVHYILIGHQNSYYGL